LASASRRVTAYLIDFTITFALFLALSNAFYPITLQFILNINLTFFFFLFWGYSTLLESLKGQTLGKKIMHIKVIQTDGKDPTNNQAAVRNLGKAFLLPFDLAFALNLKDRRFIRFFDKFAGTIVIDLEPKHPHHQKKKKTAKETAKDSSQS
jgi:uncharacterized RDD family membrane protein YckC